MQVRPFVILALVAIQGCGIYQTKRQTGTVETSPLRAEQIGYKQIFDRVIGPQCTSCHNANSTRGGIALDTYAQVHANLALIKSVAIDKRVMPPRNPLNATDTKLLSDWIGIGGPEIALESGGTVPTPAPPTPTPTPWPTPGGFVTYADISTKIIVPSCVRCHSGEHPRDNVRLESYADLVANLGKVQGAVLVKGTMPPRKPLDSGLKEWLRVWISEGAPENPNSVPAPTATPEPSATPDSTFSTLLDWLIPSASAADYAAQKAQVEFFAIGKPSMLKVHGTSSDLSGKVSTGPKGVSGKLIAKMDRFTTGGMALRDKHLKEKVLEPEKYPTSEITFTDIPVKSDGAPFKGKLKFHGKEKVVEGTAKLTDKTPAEKCVEYDVSFKLKLSEFGIEPPSYLGLSIQDEVTVTVKGEAMP